MIKGMRNLTRPTPRPLHDWPADMTRTEGGWFNRPGYPLIPRFFAESGFLRDRLSMVNGTQPLPVDLSDEAVDATLCLMLRRGK